MSQRNGEFTNELATWTLGIAGGTRMAGPGAIWSACWRRRSFIPTIGKSVLAGGREVLGRSRQDPRRPAILRHWPECTRALRRSGPVRRREAPERPASAPRPTARTAISGETCCCRRSRGRGPVPGRSAAARRQLAGGLRRCHRWPASRATCSAAAGRPGTSSSAASARLRAAAGRRPGRTCWPGSTCSPSSTRRSTPAAS